MAILLMILVVTSVVAPPNATLSKKSPGSSPIRQLAAQPDFNMRIEPNQFLVSNASWANPDPKIVITSLNGFVGNITLSTTVSPRHKSGPTFSFSIPYLFLSAPLQEAHLIVGATGMMETGVYSVTVTGSSGSITHSATATVGVTDAPVPPNGAELLYKAHFNGPAFAGGSTVLNSTFLDLGYGAVGIKELVIRFDFGTFRLPDYSMCRIPSTGACADFILPVYLWLEPYKQKTTELTITVPDSTVPGNYTVTATVTWVLGSFSQTSGPDLVTHGHLMVYPTPDTGTPPPDTSNAPPNASAKANLSSNFVTMVPSVLGGIGIAVALVMALVFLRGRDYYDIPQTLPSASIIRHLCTNCGAARAFGARSCSQCGHAFL